MPEIPHPRTWGFRISVLDACVLIAGVPVTALLWPRVGAVAGIVPITVGHFFLFCNVFRIHRTKELLWSAICIANVGAWYAMDRMWWPGILAVQLPVTVAMIAWEMSGPWYHGILARRINRRLEDYLAGTL